MDHVESNLAQYLRAVIDGSTDPILAVDRGRRLTVFNLAYAAGYRRVHGRHPRLGERTDDTIPPEHLPRLLAAYDEAVGLIERDRRIAAEAFQWVDGKAPADLDRMIADKSISFSPDPHGIMKFAAFMHEVGLLKAVPAGWQETFFAPEAARFHGD